MAYSEEITPKSEKAFTQAANRQRSVVTKVSSTGMSKKAKTEYNTVYLETSAKKFSMRNKAAAMC